MTESADDAMLRAIKDHLAREQAAAQASRARAEAQRAARKAATEFFENVVRPAMKDIEAKAADAGFSLLSGTPPSEERNHDVSAFMQFRIRASSPPYFIGAYWDADSGETVQVAVRSGRPSSFSDDSMNVHRTTREEARTVFARLLTRVLNENR